MLPEPSNFKRHALSLVATPPFWSPTAAYPPSEVGIISLPLSPFTEPHVLCQLMMPMLLVLKIQMSPSPLPELSVNPTATYPPSGACLTIYTRSHPVPP